jgi:hypothetical protein
MHLDEQSPPSALTEVEEYLKSRFQPQEKKRRVPSTSRAAGGSTARIDQLVLPDDERAKLPETRDKYLIRENPHLVAWERETRKFLRRLNPDHGHRVSAVMVYEWATGIDVAELYENGGNCNADLRKLNKLLFFYFGKPYMTYILGRKVPKAYRVPPGWYVKRHRPMTLSLYHEFANKTLNP